MRHGQGRTRLQFPTHAIGHGGGENWGAPAAAAGCAWWHPQRPAPAAGRGRAPRCPRHSSLRVNKGGTSGVCSVVDADGQQRGQGKRWKAVEHGSAHTQPRVLALSRIITSRELSSVVLRTRVLVDDAAHHHVLGGRDVPANASRRVEPATIRVWATDSSHGTPLLPTQM